MATTTINVTTLDTANYGLFAQTANSTPITNTTTETSLINGGVGSLSVPGNGFEIGDSFRAVMAGILNVANNQSIRIRVKAQDQIISAELSANETARAVRLAQTTDEGEKLQVEYENQLAALQEAHIQEQIANAGNAEALALIDKKYADLQLLATADLDQKELDLNQKNVDAQKKVDDEIIENKKKNLDDLKLIEEAKRQLVVDSLMGTLQILQDLNSQHDELSEAAAKKSFERAKALSIAEALVSTYFTAQKAYEGQFKPADTSSPIRGAVAAGLAVAQGLAKVAIIKNKNYKSKSEGSASTSSGMSAGGMSQISAPRVSSTLPQVSGFEQRVFVTEGDISRTQARVGNTKRVSVVK